LLELLGILEQSRINKRNVGDTINRNC